eukprot:1155277-Pelagomonas_calceolata.AAC.3
MSGSFAEVAEKSKREGMILKDFEFHIVRWKAPGQVLYSWPHIKAMHTYVWATGRAEAKDLQITPKL